MKLSMVAAAVVLLGGVEPVMAQTIAAATATTTTTVNVTTLADMPGIMDPGQKNTFTVGLSDAMVQDALVVTCTPGGSQLFIMHKDKICALAGTGSLVNPKNPSQVVPRTQYSGGYDVQENGIAEADGMAVNFLALGSAPASDARFGGRMHLKAELSASGMDALEASVYNKLGLGSSNDTTIDKRLDSIGITGLSIPSFGWPSDKGCTWDGKMVFAYQTSSWFIDLTANCNGKTFDLKGNMPWLPVKGVPDQMEYDLTLTLPGAVVAGDDAVFAAPDPFATVAGISGKIIQKNSDTVSPLVDGVATDTPSRVDASGTLTGTGVPVDVVRSLAFLMGLFSDNLYGP